MIARLLVALLLALTACSSGSTEPDPARLRLDDLDALVHAIETGHPEPFANTDETAWRRALAEVRAGARNMSEDEFLFAVARLANLGERNGHGGVFPTEQPRLAMWPVRLYEFADGWYVVDARDPSLVGARVEAVGGRPVDDVVRALAPAVPHDNAHSLRARVASYLVTPAFLRAVGAYGPLRVEDGFGLRREVLPEEVPPAEYALLAGLDVAQVPPALPRPAWAPKEYWFWLERRGGGLVVGYERVAYEMQDGRRAQWLVAEVERALRARRPSVLVVDARRNPGGDVNAFAPVRILLRDAARSGVPVRVLVGRATYSAAVVGLLALQRDAPKVTFYGEPTGGGAVAYGSPRAQPLPGSGIVVHVAGARVEAPGPAVPALVPDVHVGTTWAAYARGRDEVLDVALG